MLCPKCGTECGDQIRLCENCDTPRQSAEVASEAAQTSHDAQEFDTEETSDSPYAPFWIRVCAYFIDSAVVTLPCAAIVWAYRAVAERSLSSLIAGPVQEKAQISNFLVAMLIGFVLAAIGMLLLFVVANWLYSVILESSRFRATLGKRFAGLIVTDLNGDRISFGRANARYFARLFSMLPFGTGYALPLFTAHNQALHDMLAGTVVRRAEFKNPMPVLGAAIASLVMMYVVNPPSSPPRKSHATYSLSQPPAQVGDSVRPGQPPTGKQTFGRLASVTEDTKSDEAIATPTATPDLEPEENLKGPHARIRSHSSMVDAKSIIAFYYPKVNSVALGFYASQLEQSEIEMVKRRGVLTSAGSKHRPVMTLYLDFDQGAKAFEENHLKSYTVNFYQNPMAGFAFSSVNDAVSFGRLRAQFTPEDRIELSGSLEPNSKLKLTVRGKGTPRTNTTLRFRWDFDEEVVLFPSN